MAMSLTRMTAAMFEIPFRMMEFPVLMSTAVVDAMMSNDLAGDWTGNRGDRQHTRRRTASAPRRRRRA